MKRPLLAAALYCLLPLACDDSAPGANSECELPCGDGFSCDPSTQMCVPEPDMAHFDRGGMIGDADTLDRGVDVGDLALDLGSDMDVDGMLDRGVPCEPTPASPAVPYTLERGVLSSELAIGGPPVEFIPINLDGDPEQNIEFALVRGGRAAVVGQDGRTWWQSPILGIKRIAGIQDLDGDGRLEVVAVAQRTVYVFDGLTGHQIWRLPENPFTDSPNTPMVGLDRAFLADLNGDGTIELYATDGGCSRDGQGWGVVVDFSRQEGELTGRIVANVIGPRANGRCTRWHSAGDILPRPGAEIVVTDATGINVFSPTGERLACSVDLDGPAAGKYPHFIQALRAGSPDIIAFWGNGIAALAPTADVENVCDEAMIVRPRWRVVPGDRIEPQGSGATDVNADGTLDILTSIWRDGAWYVVALSGHDGSLLFEHRGRRLLGIADLNGDGRSEVLTAVNPPEQLARFGQVQLNRMRPGGLEPIGDPIDHRAVIRPRRREDAPGRTVELSPAIVVGNAFVLLDEGDAQGVASRLTLLGLGGESAAYALTGEPGNARPAGTTLGVSLVEGELAVFASDLTLRNPADTDQPIAKAPTGLVSVVIAQTPEGAATIALSESGVLRRLDLDQEAFSWQVALGRDLDTPTTSIRTLLHASLPGADAVIAVESSGGRVGWAAFSADTGDALWTHTVSGNGFVPRNAVILTTDGRADLIARTDVVRDATDIEADPSCPPDILSDPDLLAPDPECQNRRPVVRAITGIDAATGACRWRTLIRAHTFCAGPSNQQLSAADADQDGTDELYITESTAMRRIDPASGQILVTRQIVPGPDDSPRGGGWIRATGGNPSLIRTGGNGPVEALTFNLAQAWRTGTPDLRPQAWVVRDILVVGDEIWTSPTVGLPIHRFAIDDGSLRGLIAFENGQVRNDVAGDERGHDVTSMARVPNVEGPDSLFITTDEGRLYALNLDGTLAWSRSHGALIGPPQVVDVDDDGQLELIVALSDGALEVYDEPGPDAPEGIWDLPCPPIPVCDPDADIDETQLTFSLCAEWIPVADAEGYDGRVITQNGGAVVADWTPIDADQATVLFDDLPLVPSVAYCVEIRAWRQNGGRVLRSAPIRTDCVTVIDDRPPEVELVADPSCYAAGEPTELRLHAMDNDLLAGWSLVIQDDAGDQVRLIDRQPLAQAEFEATRIWDGTDEAGTPLLNARYHAVTTVVDRLGNTVSDEVLLGPCPD